MNKLKMISVHYKEAEITIRGKFVLTIEERNSLYLLLRDYLNIREALILSTCNRTEIYYVHESNLKEPLIGLLASIKGVTLSSCLPLFSSLTNGDEVLHHLFRVGVGLDSQVLGDMQIFGQVKQAYQEANEVDMAQAFLHRAIHSLFHTHKQVCQQTAFKSGAASAAYNAVKLLKERKHVSFHSEILVAGAGKVGVDICRNLLCQGFKNVTVTNRTALKSYALQEALNIKVLDYQQLFPQLNQYEVVISTIGAVEPVFTAEKMKGNTVYQRFSCIDLSVPESFSKDFILKYASHFYNIDQIGTISRDAINKRKKEVPKVEAIVWKGVQEFIGWLHTYGYTGQIKNYKDALDQLRKASIAQYLKKVDDGQQELIEEVSRSIIQRILKHSAVQLKEACERGRAEELSQTLNQIFNVDNHSFLNLKKQQL